MWYEELANNNQLSIQSGTDAGNLGTSIFNTSGTHRYFLEKRWAAEGDTLTAVMMNPSNATHDQSDATVDQLISVAKGQGCHSLHVVNISSVIDGTSGNLNNTHFAYERVNWAFVSNAMVEAKFVFLGWGIKGHLGVLKNQTENTYILRLFKNSFNKIYCYDVLKSQDHKFTKHPLYYVPHPRPRTEQGKYLHTPIRRITDHEFIQLFHR